MTIGRFGPPSAGPGGRAVPFTKAVRAGDFVFVSGQVPMGPDGEIVHGSIVEQTHQTVANIKAILADLGLGLRLMKHRAELIGGTIDIQSRPRNGSIIRCRVGEIK